MSNACSASTFRCAMSTPLACSITARDSIASRMLRACSASRSCASALATRTATASATVVAASSDSREEKAAGLEVAEIVAVAIANAESHWQQGEQARNMRLAMDSRAVIEQAKGVLMAQRNVDADVAFEILREASQRYNRKLRDIASGIVQSASEGGPR